ncbi:hypothetical protein CVU37_11635 [candidate division BRC1 bacterium HGW-BRC1-1]|nr:MAG: hypothetical protein CVU37_11635 [candidate division BRC1 bacterium HGW-BRC1-1]
MVARERQKRKQNITIEAQRLGGMQSQGGGFGGLHTACTPVAHRSQFDQKVGRDADLERKQDC